MIDPDSNETVLSRILDMHDQMMASKDYEIRKLAQDYEDLRNKIYEAQPVNQPMTYSLDAIRMAAIELKPDKNLHPQKIDAIKAVRNCFGYNLKESKELVDAVWEVMEGWQERVNREYIHEG